MLNPIFLEIVACPSCQGDLETSPEIRCKNCNLNFPIVEDIPVFINEKNSLFRITDFEQKHDTTYKTQSNWKKKLKKIIPSISLNLKAPENFRKFATRLRQENTNPRLLVIGGGVIGEGFAVEDFADQITLIETDVAFGERTNLICDAHDLPFKNGTFDGVIAQAVLEHVLDPTRCVSEIERVLKKDGMVYAETPFMQQVHAGRFDFTRFTHLGHRRLFRAFEELESGVACGAGTALAWSYSYFLQSFFNNRTMQQIAFAFGSLTGFWLKYFDYFLLEKSGSFDSASGYYFWGKKTDKILDDKKLIADYKGVIR
ncbi:MAG TPA: methyltransferase domain-containing protein [Pyrinomonadaceae bacterium]|nr:methyltransferase domain-containing protein [Pyrinomonadaceae bacterium]